MVAGYVVMRVAMVAQWLRAARQDPDRRRACLTYAATILGRPDRLDRAALRQTLAPAHVRCRARAALRRARRPAVAERRKGGTPWHAHHIAERYGLLAIIALGEGIVGTIASLSAVVGRGPGLDASTPSLSRSPAPR